MNDGNGASAFDDTCVISDVFGVSARPEVLHIGINRSDITAISDGCQSTEGVGGSIERATVIIALHILKAGVERDTPLHMPFGNGGDLKSQ